MGSAQSSQSALLSDELVRALQRNRRQLILTNVSIAITTDVIRQAQTNINLLRQKYILPGLVKADQATAEIAETEDLIQWSLRKLRITEPIYATAEKMSACADLAKSCLAQYIREHLNVEDTSNFHVDRIQSAIKDLLNGDPRPDMTEEERLFIHGLLAGLSLKEIIKTCSRAKLAIAMKRKLRKIGYDILASRFSPWQNHQRLPTPEYLYRQRPKRGKRPRAIVSAEKDNFSLESRPLDESVDQNQLGTMGQTSNSGFRGMKAFVRKLSKRLLMGGVTATRRFHLMGGLSACLRNMRWEFDDSVARIFVHGVVKGQDHHQMLLQCMTDQEYTELSHMLGYAALEAGMTIGKHWTRTADGDLVQNVLRS